MTAKEVVMNRFPIVPRRTAMLFFDAQNIYLRPEHPSPDFAREIGRVISAMVRINEACRNAGIPIFYSQGDHRPDGGDYVSTIADRGYDGRPGEPPRLLPRPRVRSGTPEAEVVWEITPELQDYIIKKHRWSAFFQTHLELSLRSAGIDTILLAGGSTEIGVASTAYSARDLDFNLIVLRDACHSLDSGVGDSLMTKVFPIFARVMTTNEAVASLVD
jgi:nicotinamidase-related amidase